MLWQLLAAVVAWLLRRRPEVNEQDYQAMCAILYRLESQGNAWHTCPELCWSPEVRPGEIFPHVHRLVKAKLLEEQRQPEETSPGRPVMLPDGSTAWKATRYRLTEQGQVVANSVFWLENDAYDVPAALYQAFGQ